MAFFFSLLQISSWEELARRGAQRGEEVVERASGCVYVGGGRCGRGWTGWRAFGPLRIGGHEVQLKASYTAGGCVLFQPGRRRELDVDGAAALAGKANDGRQLPVRLHVCAVCTTWQPHLLLCFDIHHHVATCLTLFSIVLA